jgi:tetratricopeptide (TPR) repeat protein
MDPKNEDACVFLGKTYTVQENFKKAIDTLKACDKRMKKSGIFAYYIGKMYVDKNKLGKAKKYFSKAYKRDPSFSQAVMALGLIAEEEKKVSKAIKIYEKHLKKDPNDMLILTRVVQLLFTEEKFAKVIPFAERLSDLEPDNLNLKVKLGILYTDNGQYGRAIATFKELLQHAPDNDKILYYIGAIYQETGEFDKSVEFYTRIPMESALFQDSSVQIAQMLSALGQDDYLFHKSTKGHHKQFLGFINDRLKKLPKLSVEFNVIRAGYFENIGQVDGAIESLENVSEFEDFSESHKYYLASLYEKVNEFNKSTDIIMDILAKDPRNAHAWNFLGYSLVERGVHMAKAHEFIVNALAIEPNDGYIRDSLGWYYFKIGETQKALSELKFAIKAVPSDVSIQKHLAIVYTHMKDFDQAKKWVVEALKNVQQESEKVELFKVLKTLDAKRIPASFQHPALNAK